MKMGTWMGLLTLYKFFPTVWLISHLQSYYSSANIIFKFIDDF